MLVATSQEVFRRRPGPGDAVSTGGPGTCVSQAGSFPLTHHRAQSPPWAFSQQPALWEPRQTFTFEYRGGTGRGRAAVGSPSPRRKAEPNSNDGNHLPGALGRLPASPVRAGGLVPGRGPSQALFGILHAGWAPTGGVCQTWSSKRPQDHVAPESA